MNITKRFYLWMMAVVMAVAVSSCGEDDYENSYIVGRWALMTVNNVPVAENNSFDYIFYDNGEGVRDYFTYKVPFVWSESTSNMGATYLYVEDYQGYQYSYIVRMESGYDDFYNRPCWFMYLTDMDTGDLLMFQEY